MDTQKLLEKYKDSEVTPELLANLIVDQSNELKSYYDNELKEAKKSFNLTGNVDTLVAKETTIDGKKDVITFFQSLAKKDFAKIEAMQTKLLAPLSEGVNADGGFLVPVEFSKTVIAFMDEYSQLRSRATVVPMKSATLNLNVLTGKVTITPVLEGAVIPDSKPSFGEAILTLVKRAGITAWSNELYEDAEIDIIDLLARLYAEQFAKDLQSRIVSSAVAGSQGLLVVPGTQSVTMGATRTSFDKITWDDISLALALLQENNMADAQGASILVSPSVYHALRILKASTSGEYYLPTAPSETNKPTAWGYEIVLVNEYPKLSQTAISTKFVTVTNLKNHVFIGEKPEMRVKLLTESTIDGVNLGETDQMALRAVVRNASVVVGTSGVVNIVTAAA